MFDGFLFEERVSPGRSELTTASTHGIGGVRRVGVGAGAAWGSGCVRAELGDVSAALRTSRSSRWSWLWAGEEQRSGGGHDGLRSSLLSLRGRRGAVPGSVNRLLYEVVEPGGWGDAVVGGSAGVCCEAGAPVAALGSDEPRREPGRVRRDDGRAGSVRDKLLITVLALTGLRIGQALGLHRSDMHLMANSRAVGARSRAACPRCPS